jgi:hypothetical protein
MSLKSFISLASVIGLLFSTGAHSSVENEECGCKKIKREDHVFSHNHFIMLDYSLDSFDYIGEERTPQTLFGSNLVYFTKEFSLFADILVGESSASVRPILEGKEQENEIKQLGLTIPFQIGETRERIYVGKLSLPVGLYDKQKLIPTIENGRTLTDSFASYYYNQYIPPVSEGIMIEFQTGNFIYTAGYFYPEELSLEYPLKIGGLEPYIDFLPPNYKFDFFSGGGEIVVDKNATGEFPQQITLPIALQRKLSYFSVQYDTGNDRLIKAEYLRNLQPIYTTFPEQDPNSPVRMYNTKELGDDQRYYRIGLEERFFDTYYVSIERYLESASLYDGYIFTQRAGSYGISKSYDNYTLHFSYIKWDESEIGSAEEFNAGFTYSFNENFHTRFMVRKMEGEIGLATFRSGLDQNNPVVQALGAMNPSLFDDNIIPYKESGFEFRAKYTF